MNGRGRAPPLVLIAGYSCDLSVWELVRKELARHFSLVLLDNRCIGRSECPSGPFTIEDMAKDTLDLIESLGLERPHVLGHSMGGAVAQMMARQQGGRIGKLVLAHPSIRSTPVGVAVLRSGLELLKAGVPMRLRAQVMMPWIFSNSFMANHEACEMVIKNMEQDLHPPTLEALKRQYEALVAFDSTPWQAQIRSPTLVLIGDEDLVCPPMESRRLVERVPNGQLHCFEGQAHSSLLERPAEFCQIVTGFLKK